MLTDQFMKKIINILESIILWLLYQDDNIYSSSAREKENKSVVELDGIPPADK